MQTGFPLGDDATIKFDARAPKEFTLLLRRPMWAGEGFSVRVNGQPVPALPKAPGYVEIKRVWKTGDTVALAPPKTLGLDRLADAPKHAAVGWGPLVLAGDLGAAPRRREDGDGDGVRTPLPEAPVLVTDRPVGEWLKPVAGKPGTFRATGIARTLSSNSTMDLEFAPFYAVHRRTYGAYWEFLTPAEYDGGRRAVAEEKARVARLEAATVAYLATVDPAGEKPFNMQGEETTLVRADAKPGRRSAKGFSSDLTADPAATLALVVTHNSDQR